MLDVSQHVNFDIKFAKICKKLRKKWVISLVWEQKRSCNESAVKKLTPSHKAFFK